MSFANLTNYAAADLPILAPDGREVVVVVVKASFEITAQGCVRAASQAPVRTADEVYDPDAEQSSIRLPGDLCTEKRGADVVVIGSAVSDRPVAALLVGVSVGDRLVLLRVHGERTYYRGAGGRVVVGKAAPFTEKPIVYERAYGGTSADYKVVERRNPVGRGVASDASELIDQPAPQIEHPAHPIVSGGDRPTPVGFGAISMHWSPRCDYLGTVDGQWERERMPLMPLDFNLRHHNCAHPELQLSEPLLVGTPIGIEGMTRDGALTFTVPDLAISVAGSYDDGSRQLLQPPIDTLLVDTENRLAELTCRAVFPLGRGRRRLRALRVEGA